MKRIIFLTGLIKRLIVAGLLFFCSGHLYAQPAFTLSVTPVAETCPGNGKLNFSVSGTDPSATVTYKVWRTSAPAQTEASATTTSSNTLSGLSAGTYQVKALQTLGANTNTQEQSVVIANNQVPLEFTLTPTPATCPANGSITVQVTNGTAGVYSIISGPVTRPEQSSNVFTALPTGSYLVKVTDANCPGTARTKSITITGPVNTFTMVEQKWLTETPALYCDSTQPRYYNVELGNMIPYTFEWTYTVPGAPAMTTVTRQYSTANPKFNIRFPYVYNSSYNVTLRVLNACGVQVYTNTFPVTGHRIAHDWSIGVRVPPITCAGSNGYIRIDPANWYGNYTINFTSYPAGFDPVTYNPNHPGPFTGPVEYGSASNLAPAGSYTFTITDACGNSETFTKPIGPEPSFSLTAADATEGCGADVSTRVAYITSGTVSKVLVKRVYGNNNLQSAPGAATLRNAFAAMYGVTLSGNTYYDASAHLNATGTRFYMDFPTGGANGVSPNNGLGYFEVWFYNPCGDSLRVDWRAKGYIPDNNVTVNQGCTSFDITTPPVKVINSYTFYPAGWLPAGPSNQPNYYYLQKLDPVSGNWVHPTTGAVYNEALDNLASAGQLLANNATTANLTYTGTLRVVFRHYTYQNYAIAGHASSATMKPCVSVLKEFSINPNVSFSAFTFGCSGDEVSLVVDASSSLSPLTYSLLTKNGAPYVVNNGTNPIFTGLTPAAYEVQITDNCSNNFTQLVDATYVVEPSIVPENLCENSTNASLSIANIPGLTFEWFRNDNATVILSTSSVLSFTPFFSHALHAGAYTVRISGLPNCAAKEVSYTIPGSATPPNAGQGLSKSICGSAKGVLNLFTLLGGTYDTYGTWEELTNSGVTLNGYYWDNTNVPDGTYIFKYTVPGSSCQAEAETLALVDLTNTCPITLPVRLLYFTAKGENNNAVILQWRTEMEENNDFFLVEHSVDGVNFQPIGKIKGKGTTQAVQSYQFTHQNPDLAAINYYRLKNVDFDGKAWHSAIQSVKFDSYAGIKMYASPNPVTEKKIRAVIEYVGENVPVNADCKLLSVNGQVLAQKSVILQPGRSEVLFDAGALTPGMYILQLSSNQFKGYKTAKIILR